MHAKATALAAAITLAATMMASGTPPESVAGPRLQLSSQAGIEISSLPAVIDVCGTYFVSDCLDSTGGEDGITIAADDVTLNLRGNTLTGPGTDGPTGIRVDGDRQNIVIRNGSLQGWVRGAIDARTAFVGEISGIRAILDGSSLSDGIGAGDLFIVKDCVAASTSLSPEDGISVGNASVVARCIVTGFDNGIRVRPVHHGGCAIIGCATRNNTTGFLAEGSVVSSCGSAVNTQVDIHAGLCADSYPSCP